MKDLEGRYLQVNRRFEELFDVDRGDVVGRSDAEIFPEDPRRGSSHGCSPRTTRCSPGI